MALHEYRAAHARSLGRLMAQASELDERKTGAEIKKEMVKFINQELELSARGEG